MNPRLITSAVTAPSEPARLGRGFTLLLALLVFVAALGLYELHALGSRQQEQAMQETLRLRLAQDLRVEVARAGLLARQALLPGEGSAAAAVLQQRLVAAQERAAALEQALRSAGSGDGSASAAPAWLASQIDELGSARSQTAQLFAQAHQQGQQQGQQQVRDGAAGEALRSLVHRADLAEARWQSQADELLRQLDLQGQTALRKAQEARQQQLLQFFAWSLTALLLGGALAWSAVQRLRTLLERRLPTVGPAAMAAPVAAVAPSVSAAAFTPAAARSVPEADEPVADRRGARVTSGLPQGAAMARSGRLAGKLPLPRRDAGGDWSAFDRLAGSLTRAGSEAMAPAPRPHLPLGEAPDAAAALPATAPGGVQATVQATVQEGALARTTQELPPVAAPERPREELVRDAVAAATRGGLVVSQVVANMEDIGATGRRIAETVALIDSIAFQTNLLALNAVVEAAHSEARSGALLPAALPGRTRAPSAAAGAAADVRSLAQRATQAAREIKALISAGAPADASGAQASASGITAALQQDASQTMDALLTSVQQAAELVTQVRQAAQSQAPAGVVAQSMEQLDRMQRNHAALVEQSAASAESLRLQAERLQKVLGAFKLLQQTQQAAWGAHTAIRGASERSRQPDSGLGGFVKPDDEKPGSGSWTSF